MEDTRENGQGQENKQASDEKQVFPFIKQFSIEEEWGQVEEDSEEVYQGF